MDPQRMRCWFACALVWLRLAVALGGEPGAADVYFSPHGGCTAAVCRAIAAAKTSVLVQAYSFTSEPIEKALADARGRGVSVALIVDRSQQTAKHSAADAIERAGAAVWVDSKHAIAHNKVMIIDGEVVLTGSFNFTEAAEENNAENLLVLHDRELAAKYAENWKAHVRHSRRWADSKELAAAEPADRPAAAEATGPIAADKAESAPPADAADPPLVASRHSPLFHRGDCPWAGRIAAENLVHFANRTEADASHRRPCTHCLGAK